MNTITYLGLIYAAIIFIIKIAYHLGATALAASNPGKGAKSTFHATGGIQNFILVILDTLAIAAIVNAFIQLF